MKAKFFAGLVGLVAINAAYVPALANTIQDFENGTLNGWTAGGRQLGANSWGVSEYAGSNWSYLNHIGFTELALPKSFSYSPGMALFFDAEFSINGNTSPSASGGSSLYNMAYYWIDFYDSNGNLLGERAYGAATSNFPYYKATTTPYFIIPFYPNGIGHYTQDISLLGADLGIASGDIDSFTLSFGGYSSALAGGNMLVRFDNVGTNSVSVPEPATTLLFGIGMAGFSGTRFIKGRRGELAR